MNSFLWREFEEKRVEERVGTHIEEACWRVFQWDRISRSHFYCCTETEVVRLAFIAGTHFQKGYGCIYCRHEFRGRSMDSVQFSFGARFSRKSGIDFEEEIWHISREIQHDFWGRTAAFNAVRTVRSLIVFGTVFEGQHLMLSGTEIEDC